MCTVKHINWLVLLASIILTVTGLWDSNKTFDPNKKYPNWLFVCFVRYKTTKEEYRFLVNST